MLSTFFRNLSDDTTGATAIEYGLIVAFIAIAALAALQGLASTTAEMWNDVSTEVVDAMGN